MTAINNFEEILICVRKVHKFSHIDSNNETPQSPYQEKNENYALFLPKEIRSSDSENESENCDLRISY